MSRLERAPDLLPLHPWSPPVPVVTAHVAIARTAPVHRLQPGCASRHVAFRRIPNIGRCNHPAYPLVTRCDLVAPARCSSFESTSAPRTHVRHPLTPDARTKAYPRECGFR